MTRTWIKPFSLLTLEELYELIRLRIDVFVVEQACPYHELDEKDCHNATLHLWTKDPGGAISACARILAPGVSYDGVSLGRVAVRREFRGRGLARGMVALALEKANQTWPQIPVHIGAQAYLESFYASFGFVPVSGTYLEDGIPHIDMVLHHP